VLQSAVQDFIRIFRINVDNFGRTVAMAKVGLTKRYSGSSLGVFWSVVKPAIFVGVFWFAVTIGIRGNKPVEGAPYILWLLPGIMAWFYIQDSLQIGGASIRSNSHLVTKMVYPVETIPLSEVLSLFFVHMMLMLLVVAIYVFTGFGLSVYFLQLPYYILCCFAFTLVSAQLLSALTAVSSDVLHLVKSTMQMLLWLSPILWSIHKIDSSFLRRLIMLSPITYLVEGYRNAFVYNKWFFMQWEYAAYFWGLMIVLTLFSSFLFSRLQRDFADVL